MSTARPNGPDSRHHTDNDGYAIDVYSLNKHFDDKHAAKDLPIQVARGEIFGFLGSNGSGKTTSIHMMCGLLMPDSGSGSYPGYDVLERFTQIKWYVGYMTQRSSYWDDLSIRGSLDFVVRLYEMPNRREVIDHALKHLGLVSHVKQLVDSLSGGWKQCLTLVVCMFHKPELLLFDKPTAGVDPKVRRNFWEELHRLMVEGISVLVSAHYMDGVERRRELIYIVYGKLLAQGTTDEVTAAQHLSTWSVSGGNLAEPGHKLEGQPGADQTVAFGSVLHATGADAQALEGTLHKLAGESGICAELIGTSLEDVFIYIMRRSSDNYGMQP